VVVAAGAGRTGHRNGANHGGDGMTRFRPWIWAATAAYGIVGCAWPLLGRRSHRQLTGPKTNGWLASAHVAYFTLGTLWPLFGSRSSQRVTGPKTAMWLVHAISLLRGVQAGVITSAARQKRVTPEIAQLGILSSLALATVGPVDAIRGRVPKVYLGDALAHATLAAGWI